MTLRRYLDDQLALDARSLAFGRIALALVVLFDAVQRATNSEAHYSDAGVMPRALLADPSLSLGWSLHALSGSAAFETALFALTAVAALALLVGFRTRAALFASFMLTASVQARNPYLRDGQDDWLRVILFWSLWLPLGLFFSLDARRGPPSDARVSGFCAAGLFAQMLLIYESAAIGKLQSPWWRSGEGLTQSLQLDFYETHLGHWLLGLHPLLAPINYLVIATEIALPLLLFVPGQRLRRGLVLAFMAFHIGMGTFLKLGTFPYVCVGTWIMFWPPQVLEPKPASTKPAWLALPFVALITLTIINTHAPRAIFERTSNWLALNLGLEQYWIVFSQQQPIFTGYLVVPATRTDGSEIDLFAEDGPLTWERPETVSSTFKDRRWRQFFRSFVVIAPPQTPLGAWKSEQRDATARWYCRDYQERHPNEPGLSEVKIYFVKHWLGKPEPVARHILADVRCE